MSNLKYLRAVGFVIIPVLLIGMLVTILYYFNILNQTVVSYLKLILPILGMFLGGVYLGKKSDEKGWIEGAKIGLGIIIFMFILRYLAFDKGLYIRTFIYYVILLGSSIFGGMIGISQNKNDKA